MEYYFNNDELYHYGRKGMKWGQSIFGSKKSSSSGKSKADKERAAKRQARKERWAKEREERRKIRKEKRSTKNLRKKSVKDMTDDELKKAISRLELEKRYNDLSPKKVTLGQKFLRGVGGVVGESLTKAGKELLTGTLNKYGKQFLGLDADTVSKAKSNSNSGKESTDTGAPKKKKNSSSDTFFNGTVSGASASRKESTGRSWTSSKIYTDGWDVSTPSASVRRNASLGQSYVSDLLGSGTKALPAPRDDN